MIHFAVDQERRQWGDSINCLSIQIWFRHVQFIAFNSPADSKCHTFYWNQHAGEIRCLTDSRWLPHRKANQFRQKTAIIKEWDIQSLHTYQNGRETRALLHGPSQEREQHLSNSAVRNCGHWDPPWADSPLMTHITELCTLTLNSSGFLRRPWIFPHGYLCPLPPPCLVYPVPSSLSVPQELMPSSKSITSPPSCWRLVLLLILHERVCD